MVTVEDALHVQRDELPVVYGKNAESAAPSRKDMHAWKIPEQC